MKPLKCYMDIAISEIGIKEFPGGAANPRIMEYLKTVHIDGTDEIPWCSAFVNWCMTQAGFKGTNLGTARSWLNWGNLIDKPVYGAIVIIERSALPWQGHVGFVYATVDKFIAVLGGNQSDEVKVSKYPINKVLGYRLPGVENQGVFA